MIKSIVGSVNSDAFLTIITPGFFIFMIAAIFLVSLDGSAATADISFWQTLFSIAQDVYSKPGSVFIILFVSYFFGTILRSFQVRWIEIFMPFTPRFPNSKAFRNVVLDLKNFDMLDLEENTHLLDFPEQIPLPVFNYWKSKLCIQSPHSFQFYREFESRSRFFAGMVYAGLISAVFSAAMLPFKIFHSEICMTCLVLSTCIFLIFLLTFGGIRRQEAIVLYILYLALHHQENDVE